MSNTTTIITNKCNLNVTHQSKLHFIIKSFQLDEQLNKVLSVDDKWELIYDNEYNEDLLFFNEEPICALPEEFDVKDLYEFLSHILIQKFVEKLI